MVIDTSAIIAYLCSEPEADAVLALLDTADELHMSTVNAYECRTVLLRRYGPDSVADFNALLQQGGVAVQPFDDLQSILAFDAYRKYGKGSGHPAQLNLADCAAYALARHLRLPLLFKGNDFIHTDIEPALS
ncbi:type II toxin-antitoxin system VapC family toxin [Azospirillum rugosum]|uniref:Ribonuclease VapC n=1 Tax=Azospirillum rugosum TaxID=416170 RepID=A0ABS4SF31_9PROT|nr:type II toxin-antitoxin system VapC family toxin [Azospirillum rugosum]MBP2291183.1 ribonuclease VapC [Azospirillum rugosum]MDQ0524753.1 ribonuclease VapC [Azospirillum rugosum]